MTVKLLLLDEHDRLLLIHSRDRRSGLECWYPVGGAVEPGETVHQAAAREAAEETGHCALPAGAAVWVRDHTYSYDGREVEVHEDWLLHRVEHFDPAPTALSDYERATIRGFRWWPVQDLIATSETVFHPRLGLHLHALLEDGVPSSPLDITG